MDSRKGVPPINQVPAPNATRFGAALPCSAGFNRTVGFNDEQHWC